MADRRKSLPVRRIETADHKGNDGAVVNGPQRAAAEGAEGAA
jgi:hypothetical protein